MILRSEDLKDVASKILFAVDNNALSEITETLELITKDTFLYLSVTNREYFVKVKIDLGETVNFHATVNANLFLKLISQITTDTVEITTNDNVLYVKGNGDYKLPLIFDNNELLELPTIEINNVTASFMLDSDILHSILQYNSKEFNKGTISKQVQKLYYVDELGAITFTSGACVNSFILPQPIKMLLNAKIVKLFKLFKDTQIKFSIGYDALSEDVIQTKVRFESDDIVLTAILSCDDSMLNSVPVAAIRNRANNLYQYSININKENLLQAINRLLLFNSEYKAQNNLKPYSVFEFNKDFVTIYDINKENKETLYYTNSILNIDNFYTAVLDLSDLKITLENCNEQYLVLNFGDTQSLTIARGNIINIIPECKLS